MSRGVIAPLAQKFGDGGFQLEGLPALECSLGQVWVGGGVQLFQQALGALAGIVLSLGMSEQQPAQFQGAFGFAALGCQAGGVFSICRPLVRLVMIREPISAPKTVPTPPIVEVPPRMAASRSRLA